MSTTESSIKELLKPEDPHVPHFILNLTDSYMEWYLNTILIFQHFIIDL